jgi:hypothetical protein
MIEMLLIDLPPEILIIILDQLDPSSFAIAIRTCNTFRNSALQNGKILLKNLRRIPGVKEGLDELTKPELFTLFRRRAAQSLLGVGVLYDRKTYAFDPLIMGGIDATKSSISTEHAPNAALVCRSCPLIHLYNLPCDGLTLHGVIDQSDAWDRRLSTCEVVKVVHNDHGRGLSVIYRPMPGQRMATGEQPLADEELYLWQLLPFRTKLWRTALGVIDTPVLLSTSPTYQFQPVAVAVSHRVVAISWKQEDPLGPGQVWLYRENSTPIEPESEIFKHNVIRTVDMEPDPLLQTQITHLKLDFAWLDYGYCYILSEYLPGQPVPHGSTRITIPEDLEEEGDNTITFRDYEPSTLVNLAQPSSPPSEHVFLCAPPFFSVHSYQSGFACFDTYLALGITNTHPPIATILLTFRQRPSAFCPHKVPNPFRPRRGDEWHPTAHLISYTKPDTSLPGIIAYSSGSTRIATACWKDIYVWPLSPSEWAGGRSRNLEHSESDEEVVEIEPAILHVGSVVHKLAFSNANENELWAVTSKGLVLFDMGPGCDCGVGMEVLETGMRGTEVKGTEGYWVV